MRQSIYTRMIQSNNTTFTTMSRKHASVHHLLLKVHQRSKLLRVHQIHQRSHTTSNSHNLIMQYICSFTTVQHLLMEINLQLIRPMISKGRRGGEEREQGKVRIWSREGTGARHPRKEPKGEKKIGRLNPAGRGRLRGLGTQRKRGNKKGGWAIGKVRHSRR